MSEIWVALKNYLYGIGWLLICLQFTLLGFRLLSRAMPVDVSSEIKNQNMACALMVGLALAGLIVGALYFAAHVS